jgi:16S rRNA U516 pseudouridylate synthase RsuA-like enzyme
MKKWFLVDDEWKLINADNQKDNWDLLKVVGIRKLMEWWATLLRVILNEWKKRHIRRMFSALWYRVKNLKRTKVWPFMLGTLKTWATQIQPIKKHFWINP